jgi:hypothetical protein
MSSSVQLARESFLVTFLAVLFILLINGAIPFVTVPTFGQAIWTSGFAISFSHAPILSIHANDIGYPNPSGIAFGLSGALPMGILIKLGMSPQDAYPTIVALWLTIAYFSCSAICRALKLSPRVSTLLSVLWTSQPIIWAHQDFSMLASGIALLSLYFYAAIRLFILPTGTIREKFLTSILYLGSCLISIFMDGYTFMMFAVGSSLIGACAFIRPEQRRSLILFSYPLHSVGFGAAYYLYTLYVGKSHFESASMDFFRGWGADLFYFMVPTSGIHWLWDILNLSTTRTETNLFGDASVWNTTFSLPIIITGLTAWFLCKKKSALLNILLILAFFGFYMSLGPDLKINTEKAGIIGAEMPAASAVMPTGSSLLSENLPGFNSMRASYRWTALGVFSLWLILALTLSEKHKTTHRKIIIAASLFILVSNLPHIQEKLESYKSHRKGFTELEKDLVEPLQADTDKNEVIAYLPYRNDFIATYISPASGVKTYNIGGDKNLAISKQFWPESISTLPSGRIDNRLIASTLDLLIKGQADAVIFPHINFHRDFNSWPAPTKFEESLSPIIEFLSGTGLVKIESRKYYSIIRLKESASEPPSPEEIVRSVCDGIYPVIAGPQSCALPFLLKDGWYAIEANNVWSSGKATLRIYRPLSCKTDTCRVSVRFSVYGASVSRPAHLHFQWANQSLDKEVLPSLSISTGAEKKVDLVLKHEEDFRDLIITIPRAISPKALRGGTDERVLGISLTNLDIAR